MPRGTKVLSSAGAAPHWPALASAGAAPHWPTLVSAGAAPHWPALGEANVCDEPNACDEPKKCDDKTQVVVTEDDEVVESEIGIGPTGICIGICTGISSVPPLCRLVLGSSTDSDSPEIPTESRFAILLTIRFTFGSKTGSIPSLDFG